MYKSYFVIFHRYDFVLNANQNISTYMFRAEGLADCNVKYHDASQTAILRYEGAVVNGELDVPMPEHHGKVSSFSARWCFYTVLAEIDFSNLRQGSYARGTSYLLKRCFGERSFHHVGPRVWNDLPIKIRESQSIDLLQSRLKYHIFSIIYM